MRWCTIPIWIVLAAGGGAGDASAADSTEPIRQWIDAIHEVGPEGKGNEAAAEAWKHLAGLPASRLAELLGAMDGANDLAVNWLHAAVDAVAERQRRESGAWPVLSLGEFVLEVGHHPRARSLAYELLAEAAPVAAENMLVALLNDPSVVLRRAAVQSWLEKARSLNQDNQAQAAILVYRQTLGFARDVDQIRTISAALTKAGQSVDLPRHFGFIMEWQVVGPFDNSDRTGFERVFPPEREIRLSASYEGKTGPVRWKPFVSRHQYGIVDINRALDSLKDVTAYAYAEFHSPLSRPAELRLGCKNAWKIWFNGAYLFGREEYHRGMQIDQYQLPVSLQAGKNAILVKICQNEQVEEWTREWEFQLRVCDAAGTAILSAAASAIPPVPGP